MPTVHGDTPGFGEGGASRKDGTLPSPPQAPSRGVLQGRGERKGGRFRLLSIWWSEGNRLTAWDRRLEGAGRCFKGGHLKGRPAGGTGGPSFPTPSLLQG